MECLIFIYVLDFSLYLANYGQQKSIINVWEFGLSARSQHHYTTYGI
jgi:hypothetical protein